MKLNLETNIESVVNMKLQKTTDRNAFLCPYNMRWLAGLIGK